MDANVASSFFSRLLARLVPRRILDNGISDTDVLFGNRLLYAVIAVALLWISSLSVATSIAATAVQTPSSDHVYGACQYAHRVTNQQKKDYARCVERQLVRAPLLRRDCQPLGELRG